MSFLRRAVPIVSVLAIALAGCGGGDDSADKAPPTTVAVTAAATTPADLASLIVAAPPRPGYSPITDVFAPFDLDGYLDGFSDTPDADRAILTTAGFLRGDARGWSADAESNALVVFVFEFRDAAGAGSARDKLLDQATVLKDATSFDVTGVAGAKAQSYVEDTDSGPEAVDVVSLVRANRLFLVAAQGADLGSGHGLVVELAKAQAALVP